MRRSIFPLVATVATVALAATGTASSAVAGGRGPVQRDVEGYAIAACLTAQQPAYLKDQGDGWASNIVQRGSGDIEILTALATVVRAEIAGGTMPVARDDAAPMATKPLPVQYCAEIIDTPRVRDAIKKTIRQLAPAYRKRKP